MRVVFAGTPAFSLSSLEALVAHPGARVIAVYTQPDRPAGRGKKMKPSPVKQRALELSIPVHQPVSLRDPAEIDALAALNPDLMVVTAYGLILPQPVLDIPRLGCINVHASLLPKWRGAAPIQRAIEAGDTVTGVTLMQMEAGLDTGPMLARREVPIENNDTASTLHDKLALCGGRLLSDSLDAIREQTLLPQRQNDDDACYAAKLEKAEADIDWSGSAEDIERKIRAFNPWPMAATRYGDQVLRLHQARLNEIDGSVGQPGEVLRIESNGIHVATGNGVLVITRLQKAGGKPMDVRAFINGSPLQIGARFA